MLELKAKREAAQWKPLLIELRALVGADHACSYEHLALPAGSSARGRLPLLDALYHFPRHQEPKLWFVTRCLSGVSSHEALPAEIRGIEAKADDQSAGDVRCLPGNGVEACPTCRYVMHTHGGCCSDGDHR